MKLINLLTAVIILTFFALKSFGNPECKSRGFAGSVNEFVNFNNGESFYPARNSLLEYFIEKYHFKSGNWKEESIKGYTFYTLCNEILCYRINNEVDEEDAFVINIEKRFKKDAETEVVSISSYVLEANKGSDSPPATFFVNLNLYEVTNKKKKVVKEKENINIYSQKTCTDLEDLALSARSHTENDINTPLDEHYIRAYDLCTKEPYKNYFDQ